MFLGALPILRLNDHPPRSENPTLKSEWRRGSQTLMVEKCGWLEGQCTCTFFCSPRLQLHHQQTYYYYYAQACDDTAYIGNVDEVVFSERLNDRFDGVLHQSQRLAVTASTPACNNSLMTTCFIDAAAQHPLITSTRKYSDHASLFVGWLVRLFVRSLR